MNTTISLIKKLSCQSRHFGTTKRVRPHERPEIRQQATAASRDLILLSQFTKESHSPSPFFGFVNFNPKMKKMRTRTSGGELSRFR